VGKKLKAQTSGAPTRVADEELIDIEQAIERLKTSRPTFYRWLREGKLKGMKVGRQWRFYPSEIEAFLKGEAQRVEAGPDMTALIKQLEEFQKKRTGTGTPSEASNVVAAANLLLLISIGLRASDIHLTPLVAVDGLSKIGVISFRLNRELETVAEVELKQFRALLERLKLLAHFDMQDKVSAQSNRVEITVGGKQYDLQMNLLPTSYGESLTIRILPKEVGTLVLEKMRFSKTVTDRVRAFLRRAWGMMIVTAPSGSGKTTVMYACLNELASPKRKCITVESIVEVSLPWVMQVPVSAQAGMAAALRGALRADPDVIMVGELRDETSLKMTMDAALGGHLVLTSLHTDEAASALRRLVDAGADPFIAAEATKLIVAQRLVRQLCAECKRTAKPSERALAAASELARLGGLNWDSLTKKFHEPAGCNACARTGYAGRLLIAEALEISPEIAGALRRNASAEELRALAVGQGMVTLAADGVRCAAEGLTTLEEVFRSAPIPATVTALTS